MSKSSPIYLQLGRHEEALAMQRRSWEINKGNVSEAPEYVFGIALSLARVLFDSSRYAEAKTFCQEQIPIAQGALGGEHPNTLRLKHVYAMCLQYCHKAAVENDDVAPSDSLLEDHVEATRILEELTPIARRVFGPHHHSAALFERELLRARRRVNHHSGEADWNLDPGA